MASGSRSFTATGSVTTPRRMARLPLCGFLLSDASRVMTQPFHDGELAVAETGRGEWNCHPGSVARSIPPFLASPRSFCRADLGRGRDR